MKAKAHAKVPTLTCTSSNVVKTVLQAFAQVEGLHVFFGPDTYMGRNLQELFQALAEKQEADPSGKPVRPLPARISSTCSGSGAVARPR